LGWHGIIRLGKRGNFTCKRTPLAGPKIAPAIKNLQFGVAKKTENPQSIASPPIGLITVENDGGLGRDPILPAKLCKSLWLNVIPNRLILKIPAPINMHRSRNVT